MSTAHAKQGPPVTVIGLGAMGTALARAFLEAGHETTVWNRSSDKGEELVTAGATRADSVGDAIAASPLVVLCVLDDAVVGGLLDPAGGALSGRVLVNLTSGTPEQARARAASVTQRGADYLDGKIMATPSMIGRPEAFLLYSGPEDVFEEHRPTLAALGAPTHFGADASLASLYDLALLDLMYATMTGFLHAAAMVGADGIDIATFLPHATGFLANVSAFLADIAAHAQTGDYADTEATLDMQLVAIDHIVQTSRARGVDATIPVHVQGRVRRAIAAGHGDDDLGRLLDQLTTPAA